MDACGPQVDTTANARDSDRDRCTRERERECALICCSRGVRAVAAKHNVYYELRVQHGVLSASMRSNRQYDATCNMIKCMGRQLYRLGTICGVVAGCGVGIGENNQIKFAHQRSLRGVHENLDITIEGECCADRPEKFHARVHACTAPCTVMAAPGVSCIFIAPRQGAVRGACSPTFCSPLSMGRKTIQCPENAQ